MIKKLLISLALCLITFSANALEIKKQHGTLAINYTLDDLDLRGILTRYGDYNELQVSFEFWTNEANKEWKFVNIDDPTMVSKVKQKVVKIDDHKARVTFIFPKGLLPAYVDNQYVPVYKLLFFYSNKAAVEDGDRQVLLALRPYTLSAD